MLKKFIHLLISFSAFSICYLLAFLTEIPVLQNVILYIFLIQWVLFIPAYLFKTEKFYDLAGSSTYIFAVSYILYDSSQNLTNLILGTAIIIWAVRLGSFLFFRIKKAGEDKRFKEIKQSPTRFFLAWSLQGMWVSMCSLCALTALSTENGVVLNGYLYLGFGLFLTGFLIEIIADKQKSKFRSNLDNKDKFINTGLWSKSRHPNYLGEIILWLGISIMSISSLSGLQYLTLVSPLFTYLLLVYVSGVRLLEESGNKKWGHLNSYKEYVKNTPVLFFK
jgi:steroid 5-alpha reductase family enzyme